MHSRTDRKLLATFVVILLGAFIISSMATCSKEVGNPENGRRWYSMNNCDSCHGDNGVNGIAPAIAGTDLGFGSFLKNLRKPDSVSKPTYSETEISKQDVIDMYVWLRKKSQ